MRARLRRLGPLLLLVLATAHQFALLRGLAELRAYASHGRQQAMAPFRIAGNLYYVGTRDVTAFLLTGPQGHVLIDGGYPGSASMILSSIEQLGFAPREVRVLLNSHGHFDHAGGLAALQRATGAQLWISARDAEAVASGGRHDSLWPLRLLGRLGLADFPPPRIDHRFADGAQVQLGPLALTAYLTAGHTPGCTSWSFPVRDGARTLQAVHVCSLTVFPRLQPFAAENYPGETADFRRSFATLRALPGELFLAPHAEFFDLQRKRAAQAQAGDPAAPFLDRAGYLAGIDAAERRLQARTGTAAQP
jgi:metallo-beta-lactamase class B